MTIIIYSVLLLRRQAFAVVDSVQAKTRENLETSADIAGVLSKLCVLRIRRGTYFAKRAPALARVLYPRENHAGITARTVGTIRPKEVAMSKLRL